MTMRLTLSTGRRPPTGKFPRLYRNILNHQDLINEDWHAAV